MFNIRLKKLPKRFQIIVGIFIVILAGGILYLDQTGKLAIKADTGPNSITGTVTDRDGKPLSGVSISDGLGHETTSYYNGRYGLGALPSSNVNLLFKKDGESWLTDVTSRLTEGKGISDNSSISTASQQDVYAVLNAQIMTLQKLTTYQYTDPANPASKITINEYRFNPKTEIARVDLAVALYRSLGLAKSPNSNPLKPVFKDIPSTYPFFNEIEALYYDDTITGYKEADGSTTFRPTEKINRAQMAVFLAKALKLDTTSTQVTMFSDLPSPTYDWAIPSIEALKGEEIINGYPDGTYRPGINVNREQLASFLIKTFKTIAPTKGGYDRVIKLFNLSAGTSTNVMNVTFNPAMTPVGQYGKIQGKLTDASNIPVVGANIALLVDMDTQEMYSRTSRAGGVFNFFNIPPGNYGYSINDLTGNSEYKLSAANWENSVLVTPKQTTSLNLTGITKLASPTLAAAKFTAAASKQLSCPSYGSLYFNCSLCPDTCCSNFNIPGNFGTYCITPPGAPTPVSTSTAPPTPSTGKTIISGEVNFLGPNSTTPATCSETDRKTIGGKKIDISSKSTGKLLGSTSTRYNSTTKKVEYSISVPNIVSTDQFKVLLGDTNYFTEELGYKLISPGNYKIDLLVQPKSVWLLGNVYDRKTGQGIQSIRVYEEISQKGIITPQSGYYAFKINLSKPTFESSLTVKDEYRRYVVGDYVDAPLGCPVNHVDIPLDKDKICANPGSGDVKICWWGPMAKALKDNPTYNQRWIDLVSKIDQLRFYAKSNFPSQLNIVSTSNSYAGWASLQTKQIMTSYDYVQNSWPRLINTVISHEYGHVFETTSQLSPDNFEILLGKYANLTQPKGPYTAAKAYQLVTDDWYWSNTESEYAGTNDLELYAETFSSMFNFNEKMKAAISSTAYPADLRSLAKQAYNAISPYVVGRPVLP